MSERSCCVGLLLAGSARDPLRDTLVAAGYEVRIAPDARGLRALLASGAVHAWVFDVRDDGLVEPLLATGCFVLPVDDAPTALDQASLANWCARLVGQLDAALDRRGLDHSPTAHGTWRQVRGVWLLAGSAGATSAVQAFLNTFERPPPVAFVYAQHYPPDKQAQLDGFVPQNEIFSLRVGVGRHTLAPGRIVMIPPHCKVTVGPFGQVASTRVVWGARHTPDINELLVILTAAGLPSPGVIVFSGMGDDGASALPVFDAAGGRIWVQSPDSAICRGMPQAAIDTGLVHRTGTPRQLARALEQLYDDARRA